MTTEDTKAKDTKATKDAPKDEAPTGAAGRVRLPSDEDLGVIVDYEGNEIPVKQVVHDVPASDGKGGMIMVPANEPGHPDVTTSPVS